MRLFTEFFESVPLFLPGVIVWVLLSAFLAPTVARLLGAHRVPVFLVLISFGFVVMATLTPTASFVSGADPSAGCDLSRLGIPPLSELTTVNDTLRNVLLFIPLGFTLGLLPRTRATLWLILLAYLLPAIIEALQLVLTPLQRGCQSADVIDNALGLTIGLVVGLLSVAVVRRAVPTRDQA